MKHKRNKIKDKVVNALFLDKDGNILIKKMKVVLI